MGYLRETLLQHVRDSKGRHTKFAKRRGGPIDFNRILFTTLNRAKRKLPDFYLVQRNREGISGFFFLGLFRQRFMISRVEKCSRMRQDCNATGIKVELFRTNRRILRDFYFTRFSTKDFLA